MLAEHTLAYMVGCKLGRLDAKVCKPAKDFSAPSDKGRSANFIAGYKDGYRRESNRIAMKVQAPRPPINARCHVCGGPEGNCKCLT